MKTPLLLATVMVVMLLPLVTAAPNDYVAASYPFDVNYSDVGPLGNSITSTSLTTINTTQYKLGNGSATWNFGSAGTMTIPTAVNMTYNWSFSAWLYKTQFGTSADEDYIIGDWAGANFNILLTVYTKNGSIRICNGNGGAADCKETNLTLGSNAWTHFAMSRNGTNVKMWINGSSAMDWNSAYQGAQTANTRRLGAATTPTSADSFNGTMDDVTFFNASINQNDIDILFNSGSGDAYPFSGGGGGPVQTLTIRAQNLINSTYIAGICANATNGSSSANSCNSTGTMVMFNQSQVFGTVNITVFNVTHHYNATSQNYAFTSSATKDVPTWQAWVQLTASRAYIGTAISIFNATNGGASNQTTAGTMYLPANNGTQNISVIVSGNYTETYLVTPTNIYTTTAYDANNTYDAKYNFTAFALNTQSGIQAFTVYLNSSLFTSVNRTATNYNVTFPTLQGYAHTAVLQASGYAYQNTTFTTSNAWGSYNFTVYTTNSINISFYDEMNDNLLSGMLVSLEYIGTYQSGNTTTTSGHIYLDLLTPDSYILRYNAPDYNTRFYDFTLYNNTFNRLNLTLLNTSEDGNQNVTVTVKDNLDNFIPNAVVKLYKYDVTTNSYDLISTRNTNFQGKTVFDLLVDREFYKFIVEYEGEVVLTTSPSYIYGTSITLIIDLITGSGFTPAITNSRISGQIVFINSSNTLAFTYNDASNTANQGCIYVYRLTSTGRTAYNQTCSTTPSGTVYAVVERLNNTAYIAEGKVQDSGGMWHLVTSYTVVFDNPMPDSQENLFFMFIIMAVFALIGIWKIEVSILLASSVPMLFSMAQLTRLGYIYTVPIFVLGLVFAWVVARR